MYSPRINTSGGIQQIFSSDPDQLKNPDPNHGIVELQFVDSGSNVLA